MHEVLYYICAGTAVTIDSCFWLH